jgi:hypothetical protein
MREGLLSRSRAVIIFFTPIVWMFMRVCMQVSCDAIIAPPPNTYFVENVMYTSPQIENLTANCSTEGANRKITVLGRFRSSRPICPYLHEFCMDRDETWLDNSY